MKKFFAELNAFYPEYLEAHNNAANRVLHFIGASGFFILVALAFSESNYLYFIAAVLTGYLLPGLGHRFFQHNNSFRTTRPILCVLCAFRMYLETFLLPFRRKQISIK